MFRKISAVLLSLLLVWYAAEQDRDEKGKTNDTSGIAVYAPLHNEVLGEDGEEICGQVRLTAVLRSKKSSLPVRVDFILEGSSDIYRQSVEITDESLDERDFYCATAVFQISKAAYIRRGSNRRREHSSTIFCQRTATPLRACCSERRSCLRSIMRDGSVVPSSSWRRSQMYDTGEKTTLQVRVYIASK